MSVYILGFYTLTNKLVENSTRLDVQREFEEMFSMQGENKDNVVNLLTDKYVNYKQSYVKHLLFNQNTPNLSECRFQCFRKKIFFQLKRWSMHHWILCTFSLPQLTTMRLKET